MKNNIKLAFSGWAGYCLLLLSSIGLPFALSGCQSAVSESVTGVTEVCTAAVASKGYATQAQLSTLAADLKKFPNSPLSPSDNQVIANVVSELLAHKAANLVSGAAVDAVNNAIAALNSTQSGATVTLNTGLIWTELQQVAAGIQQEVNYATGTAPATTSSLGPVRFSPIAALAEDNSALPYLVER